MIFPIFREIKQVMKHLLTLFFLSVFCWSLSAQAPECDGIRYYDEIFDVDYTGAIEYGEALQPTFFNPDATTTLRLDVYEPEGDTLSARPLIIWAFGGSFVFGTRLSPDLVTLSNEFASRGYVNASIDYRLTSDLVVDNTPENGYRAVMKATHDMAAAVRFFRKDAATDNLYRIDTTRIYVGGVSAGAFAALHLAHLNELDEIPDEIYQEFLDNGGLVGNSGNPGYSNDVAAVINLSGAIGDTAWMDPVPVIPTVSMHGTNDGTVPYGSEIIETLGIDLPVDGSASIHARLDEQGIPNTFFTWYGAGHTPFVTDGDYMDTTVWTVRDFLFDINCPPEDPATSINDISDELEFTVFPNPSSGQVSLEFSAIEPNVKTVVFLDGVGRQVFSQELSNLRESINIAHFPKGFYAVLILNEDGAVLGKKKLILQP